MKILFNKCHEKDACIVSCVSMILDKNPEHVFAEIYKTYVSLRDADEEKTFLKSYIEMHGLSCTYELPHELDEGLYLAVISTRSGGWHAVLVSIYKGELKVVDPDMITQRTFYGFDAQAYTPRGFYPVLKIDWDDYANFHGDKVL
ncbi:hypothetical protein SM033_00129 [Vibrio phage vB_VpaM_sm033]|nr:hypothetical protein SM033_00129 [Vibrio phage vB_VpaM_sm033]